MSKLFCDLKAGKNICKICNEDAYYPPRNPRKRTVVISGETHSVMQLFKCGHGMCLDCYEKMCNTTRFSCPFCRNKGAVIMETFGSPIVRSKIHTISDFLNEWEDRMYLLKFMLRPHPYLLLHNQIVQDTKITREVKSTKSKRYPKKKKKRRK